MSIDELLKKPYSKVTIELKDNYKINDIKKILSKEGSTMINLVINTDKHKAYYSLGNSRKFDLNHLKDLKAKEYVLKITF